MKNIEEKLNNLKKFDEVDRSSFPYWFNHWKAYNLVAKKLHVWKFKYLFHDWYKPWLRLFMPYEKVKWLHRNHSKHHIEWLEHKFKKCENCLYTSGYKYIDSLDYEGALIDWECSRFTKNAALMNAYDKYHEIFQRENFKNHFPELYHQGCFTILESNFFKTIEKLGLNSED